MLGRESRSETLGLGGGNIRVEMKAVLGVCLGGAIGACLRYGILLAFQRTDARFPYATLSANALGCLVAGAVWFLIAEREFLSPQWRAFLVTGLLGALTTFSTFGVDTYLLWLGGNRQMAVLVILANLLLGLGAVALGWRVAASLA